MTALLAPSVVGRAAELAVLRSALDAVTDGSGSAILLTGEAGVGKTRLLREVRRWAVECGAATMLGRAVDTATAAPFRPLTEALLAVYRSGFPDTDPDVAPFREALARLVPGLGDAAGPPAPVLHVAEGFLRVARSRGRAARGVVVLLDDLHAADAETLAVVEYLADNVVDEPVLLIAASRPDGGAGLPPILRGMVDRRAAQVLALSRFTDEEVAAMTRCCLRDPAVPAEVLRLVTDRADGLPFFVEELLTGLVHGGALTRRDGRWMVSGRERARLPASFAESVRGRSAALAPHVERIVLDAALLGRRIDTDLLGQVCGAPPEMVGSAVDAALAQGLLEVTDLGLRFRHALTRDALLDGLVPHERRARSSRALTALRAAQPDLPGELAQVAADLAEAAGEVAAAVGLLLEVGRRAAAQGALITAESVQRRALTLARGGPAEVDAREALVSTLGLAGRADDAFPHGEVLLAQLAEPELDPGGTRRRAVHLALARVAVVITDWALAAVHLDLARSADDPVDAARVQTLDAVIAIGQYRLDDADRLAAAAVTAAERAADPDLLCEALLVHGRSTRVRDLDAAARTLARARDTARAAGLVHREARALTELGIVQAYRSGDGALLLEACRLAEVCGAPETQAVALNALSVAAWFRGDAAGVLAHGDAAVVLARRYALGQLVPAALIMVASGHALRGDREHMSVCLAEAQPLVGGEPTELIALHAHARGACAFAHDDLATAGAELAAAVDIALAERPTILPPLVGMHVVLRAVGGDDPTSLVRSFRERFYDTGPQLAAILQVAEAVQHGRAGDVTAADTTAEHALRSLANNTFVQALTARLIAPVADDHGWGNPSAWLGAAITVFVERKLPGPADACRAALRRIGVPAADGDGLLTAREREVLDLVAEGLPNKAIAGRLYLSPRTVEKHVERLLAKTGSANRAQLATYAVRRGTDT